MDLVLTIDNVELLDCDREKENEEDCVSDDVFVIDVVYDGEEVAFDDRVVERSNVRDCDDDNANVCVNEDEVDAENGGERVAMVTQVRDCETLPDCVALP